MALAGTEANTLNTQGGDQGWISLPLISERRPSPYRRALKNEDVSCMPLYLLFLPPNLALQLFRAEADCE